MELPNTYMNNNQINGKQDENLRNQNPDYDQKINQFTFQQIELYLQNYVIIK